MSVEGPLLVCRVVLTAVVFAVTTCATDSQVLFTTSVPPDLASTTDETTGTTTTFTTETSTSEFNAAGVSTNKEGDLAALLSALLMYSLVWLGCIVAFSLLRLKFPLIYSNNVLTNAAPPRVRPSNRPWGWAVASFQLRTKEVFKHSGLDAAMFLEFTHLCMRILAIAGIPLMVGVAPLYEANKRHQESEELSRIELGNVQDEQRWLQYLVAALVWFVVSVTQKSVFHAQTKFLKMRFQWLKELPYPRSATILVEAIPEKFRQDKKLREFFEHLFSPESVQYAGVVKKSSSLLDLTSRFDVAKRKLYEARLQIAKDACEPMKRITTPGPKMGQNVPAIGFYEQELRELGPQIRRERHRLKRVAEDVGGVNTSYGFVTFRRRREAEMAQDSRYSANREEWIVSVAPDPESVRWKDLRHTRETVTWFRQMLGYGCIGGLMFGYLVIVTTITSIAKLINFNNLGMPALQPPWEALAPTIGLQIMVSILPTILLLIFRQFFILKDDSWSQHSLQRWYFWFQVIYVILAACIGQSLASRAKELAEQPFRILALLAEELPHTTHFYMNFLVLQWSTHGINMLRHSVLVKYNLWRVLYPEEEARQKAEPEDQDYYGIGSRSTRFTINMLIGIIFSTISPLVAVLAFITFAMCRLQYGYLLVFAETKKPDLGGVFWVTQLEHVQFGVMIYCTLMTGMLAESAATTGVDPPAIIAALALLFTVWSYFRFRIAFDWVKLPLNQIDFDGTQVEESAADASQAYVQPELKEDPELENYAHAGEEQEVDSEGFAVVNRMMDVFNRTNQVVNGVGQTLERTLLGAESSDEAQGWAGVAAEAAGGKQRTESAASAEGQSSAAQNPHKHQRRKLLSRWTKDQHTIQPQGDASNHAGDSEQGVQKPCECSARGDGAPSSSNAEVEGTSRQAC